MPTYVYGCSACGFEFEQVQRFQDAPLKTCPQCEGSVRRVFQPVGIVFKGSGWHSTDYRAGASSKESTDKAEGTDSTSGEKVADAPVKDAKTKTPSPSPAPSSSTVAGD